APRAGTPPTRPVSTPGPVPPVHPAPPTLPVPPVHPAPPTLPVPPVHPAPPTLPVPPVHPLPRPGVAHDRLVPPASAVAARDHRAGTSRPGPADRAGPGAQSAARRGMPGRGRVALTRRGRNPQPVAGPAVWPPRWRTPGRLHAHLDPDEPRGPTLQQGTPARARRGPGCPAPARNRCGNRRRHRPGRVAAGPGGDRLVGRPRLPPTGPRTAQLRTGRTGAHQPGPAAHHSTHAVLRRARTVLPTKPRRLRLQLRL